MRDRVQFLDGLRGIAAVQVLLLHDLSAFLPAVGLLDPALLRHGWEGWLPHSPLFLLADGYAAVFLFFLISGAALTWSFQARPFAVWPNTMRRIVRLGLPMAASVLLAAVWFALLPDVHRAAGRISGSLDWLGGSGPPMVSLHALAREVLFDSLLTGHADPWSTLLPARLAAALGLPPNGAAFNGPLWSLHFEFYGSLLVMALVACRTGPRRWYWVIAPASLVLLIGNPLGLFVLGHLLAPVIASPGARRFAATPAGWMAGGAALLLAAAAATYHWLAAPAAVLAAWAAMIGLPASFDIFHAQAAMEAVSLFAAVLLLSPVRRLLASAPSQWLGRYSFSLYLVHFPILLTVASLAFVRLDGVPGAALWASLAGALVTLPAMWLFERLIDRPAIALSRRIGTTGG